MLLFPPFHVIYPPGIEIHKGYAFILNPPEFWGVVGTVDMRMLFMQIFMVALLSGLTYWFLRVMNNKRDR
jgi:hypothetical protein